MAVNSPEVRSIFSRSLLNCPSVELWSTYLVFIKRVSTLHLQLKQALVQQLGVHTTPMSIQFMTSIQGNIGLHGLTLAMSHSSSKELRHLASTSSFCTPFVYC